MAVLEVNNIEKHFGSTRVLKDVSFSLEKGNALAIIGSSGSGKTTLLRCLNFLETPNQGTIAVNGETIFDASRPVKMSDEELRSKRAALWHGISGISLISTVYGTGKCHTG